jgi:hypothetical protein
MQDHNLLKKVIENPLGPGADYDFIPVMAFSKSFSEKVLLACPYPLKRESPPYPRNPPADAPHCDWKSQIVSCRNPLYA